jgi:hypothetical protein
MKDNVRLYYIEANKNRREQQQIARENPLQAGAGDKVGNVENLLDIDFDGSAPASASNQPPPAGGLEDLVGEVASPVSPSGPAGSGSNLDDLLGLSNGPPQSTSSGIQDLNGFSGLDLNAEQPPPPQIQQKKATNEDILGLF